MISTKKRIAVTLTATILTTALAVPATATEALAIRVSSYKGSTLEVGERSGIIIGPSGTDYTVTSSNPDTVAVEQVLTFWVAVAKGSGTAVITASNSTGECGSVTLTVGAAADSAPLKVPASGDSAVRSVHLTLHCAFERAVKERLIPRNPTDDCIAPKVQKVEMKTLLPEHLKSYLDAANTRNVLPMFYLELVSGLRKGELVALLWSDLDTEHRTISVSKQYVRNPSGEVMLSRPKTETSVRQVSIPQDAVDLLVQEHSKHPDNQYMFPSPVTGEMYHPDSVVKLHEKMLKDAGLEHIRFHDLRHTFATLALQNGVDVKTVSSMLGHYDAGFTLRTYTHATRQMQNQAAETMGNFMAQVM